MSRYVYVGVAPHIKSKTTIISVQLVQTLCLVLLVAGGVYNLGFGALVNVGVCVGACFVIDYVINMLKNKNFVMPDLSAVNIGLTLALCLPSGANFYVPLVASFVAIFLVRFVSGGYGKTFVSEVAVAIIVCALIFKEGFFGAFELAGTAGTSELDRVLVGAGSELNLLDMLFGKTYGAMGLSQPALALALGIVLCAFGVADYVVPIFYLFAVSVMSLVLFDTAVIINLLLVSGVVFVAFFVATDYGAMPTSRVGKIACSVGAGVLTAVIWRFGANASLGAFYALLIVSLISGGVKHLIRPVFQ